MWHAKFIGKTKQASDIWEFMFTRPEGYEYIPGQYASVVLPELSGDPRGNTRTMSFVSHPNDQYLAFVTRIPNSPSHFKARLSTLQKDDAVFFDAALGDLVLPRSTATPLVFVAGGIGIASFVSMLHDMQLSNEGREVHLLYALRSHEERLFPDLLDAFPFMQREYYVAPRRLNAELILHAPAPRSDALYYLSGTERFVESLRADLLKQGLSDTQIVFDYFTGYL